MTDVNPDSALSWKAKLLIAVGVSIVVLPILYVALVTMALRAHLKDDCRMMLGRNIGILSRQHAAKHNGQFPMKWSDLEWDDLEEITNASWGWQFICPSVGHGVGDWKQVDLWSDYRLIPGRTTNDAPDTILAIEPLSNHETGANVLFVDGSTTWWPAAKVIGGKLLSTNSP